MTTFFLTSTTTSPSPPCLLQRHRFSLPSSPTHHLQASVMQRIGILSFDCRSRRTLMCAINQDGQTNTLRTADPDEDAREEVIQAWYLDDSDADQRLPHHKEPKEFVSLDQLAELGVLSWRLDADNPDTDPDLKRIREDRGYSYMDVCEACPEKLPNYEEKIKNFFEEHLHTDEEIRYCVAGSGYFDVRDRNDAWIRVWMKKGAMIILPAGMYHRFTLDETNYIKALLFSVGEPVWTPYNRPHDHLPARKEYIQAFVEKDVANHAVDATA